MAMACSCLPRRPRTRARSSTSPLYRLLGMGGGGGDLKEGILGQLDEEDLGVVGRGLGEEGKEAAPEPAQLPRLLPSGRHLVALRQRVEELPQPTPHLQQQRQYRMLGTP